MGIVGAGGYIYVDDVFRLWFLFQSAIAIDSFSQFEQIGSGVSHLGSKE
jgi:hypothetical protein